MSKIKIAYIVSGLTIGGVEKYVVDLVNNINRKKFIPIIISLTQNGPISSLINYPGLKLYKMKKNKGNDISLPFRIAKVLRKEKIDIIHSNNWSTFVESIIAKWIGNIPKIVHVQHGMEYNQEEIFSPLLRKRRNRIRHYFSYFVDQLVTVSSAGWKFISDEWNVDEKRVNLIYNGVALENLNLLRSKQSDIREYLGYKEDDFVICCVGRLSAVKNHKCLIEAFHYLTKKIQKVKLVIIGDGEEKDHLNSLKRSFGLNNNLRFLGQKIDVINYLPAMDLFALSSISEGISLSILEAMANELPVVVTNVGGNPEIVQDGKTGILVESNNAKELSESILSIIKDTVKRKQMGFKARKCVEEKFSLYRMVSNYEDLYNSLLNK